MKMKMTTKMRALGMVMVVGFALAACGTGDKEAEMMKEEDMKTEMKDTTAMMKNMSGMLSSEGDHETKGMVEIKDNMLMLSDFMTANGPDVHVWLSKDNDMAQAFDVAKLDLGVSEQSFDISMVPMSDYNTVIIYCNDAQAVFGSATLSMMQDK